MQIFNYEYRKHQDLQRIQKALHKRQQLIERVSPFVGKDIIKVFTGQLRVGKSYMLFQTGDLILVQFPQANIIYINMELAEFGFIRKNWKVNSKD